MDKPRFYNTASRKLEEFTPLSCEVVSLYHCGPTVYNYAHIGNMRAYVFADTIRRTLEWEGYTVKQVVNITDVGHLVSDGDEGEDKVESGARREGISVEEIIKKYTGAFFEDCRSLNILPATEYPRATLHIPEQIALIKKLEEKGFTYATRDGIYFDTKKFPNYASFAHLNLDGLSAGERVDMGDKRNITDFALWKFHAGDGYRMQEWDSPWGKGFPGWHIECSAMSMKCLGTETIDIHTGGVDHIPVHHTNEIAQSECATGKQFARYWMHVAFMSVDGQKMSKSLGNTYRISELKEKFGISPLGYRYWLLTSHYRTQVNFTVEAVQAAEIALERLKNKISKLPEGSTPKEDYIKTIRVNINNDLNTALVLAQLHTLLASGCDIDKVTISKIDQILGLDLLTPSTEEENIRAIPEDIILLANERLEAKKLKNWNRADELRTEISSRGFTLEDTQNGQTIVRWVE